MSKDIISAPFEAISGVFGGAMKAPKINIPPEATPPPPPPLAEETTMPDPGDIQKKKKRQQSVLQSISGGNASTILSDAVQKIGG